MKTRKETTTTQSKKIVAAIRRINVRESQLVNDNHNQLIITMVPYSQCFLIA